MEVYSKQALLTSTAISYCVQIFIEVIVNVTTDLEVSVNEGTGYVRICLEADHATQSVYEVGITTLDDSATGIYSPSNLEFKRVILFLVTMQLGKTLLA